MHHTGHRWRSFPAEADACLVFYFICSYFSYINFFIKYPVKIYSIICVHSMWIAMCVVPSPPTVCMFCAWPDAHLRVCAWPSLCVCVCVCAMPSLHSTPSELLPLLLLWCVCVCVCRGWGGRGGGHPTGKHCVPGKAVCVRERDRHTGRQQRRLRDLPAKRTETRGIQERQEKKRLHLEGGREGRRKEKKGRVRARTKSRGDNTPDVHGQRDEEDANMGR